MIHSPSRFFGKADMEPCLYAAGAAECYGMKCGACARILLQHRGGLVGFVFCFSLIWKLQFTMQSSELEAQGTVPVSLPFFHGLPPSSPLNPNLTNPQETPQALQSESDSENKTASALKRWPRWN